MDFPKYLEIKYLEWQSQQGRRKTLTQFAQYLGIGQSTLSAYIYGTRKPDEATIAKLAEKLGLEVYDSLNLPRPDPDLYYIQTIWQNLNQNARRQLREKAEEYNASKKQK